MSYTHLIKIYSIHAILVIGFPSKVIYMFEGLMNKN